MGQSWASTGDLLHRMGNCCHSVEGGLKNDRHAGRSTASCDCPLCPHVQHPSDIKYLLLKFLSLSLFGHAMISLDILILVLTMKPRVNQGYGAFDPWVKDHRLNPIVIKDLLSSRMNSL